MPGPAAPPHDVARDGVLERAKLIVRDAEPWAAEQGVQGWRSNESVLDRLVFDSGDEQLAYVVHNSDAYGVGVLAVADVVMVAGVSQSWMGGDVVNYNICVRFMISRKETGPRQFAAAAIDCPPEIPAARPPYEEPVPVGE